MRRLMRGAAWLLVAVLGGPGSGASARPLEFETKEVTDPDLALTPDGRTLIFVLTGHLFRLPVDGGAAVQLTFGPHYNSEPAVSPDGRGVAFVSDRDGGVPDLYLLDLASGATSRLTRGAHASQPSWAPDGRSIAFARVLAREEHPPALVPRFFAARGLREPRRLALPGGEVTVLAPPRLVGAMIHLPDGRPAWTVIEPGPPGAGGGPFPGRSSARIEAPGADGRVATLRTLDGDPGRLAVSPRGDGFYAFSAGDLRLIPLDGGEPREVAELPGGRGSSAFVVAPDGRRAFAAQGGQIHEVALVTGAPRVVDFSARVTLEVAEPARPRWTPPDAPEAPARPVAVTGPRLSPDGRRLVFEAAGDLWQQPLPDGPAERLTDDGASGRDPAFSPDGRRLAFARGEPGRRQVAVYDFEGGRVRAVVELGGRSWGLWPGWSPDGSRLVFQRSDALFAPIALMEARLDDGSTAKLGDGSIGWTARPHPSADGRSLYYTGRASGSGTGTLYRLTPGEGAAPAALTELDGPLSDALVSPDGSWVAFRRNAGIWAAPLVDLPVREGQVRRLAAEGGRSFAFTPDGSAVIYAEGPRVWRQPLAGGDREAVPIRLETRRPEAPPPLLLRRVQVLDLAGGRFGPESSMLIEGGRIRRIGPASEVEPPPGATVLDAGGRHAIPGLFDLHVHASWANHEADPDAFIAYGVTSVRDTGGRLDRLVALADRGEISGGPLPRYFFSGEIFEGARPNWGDAFLQVADAEDAREHVRLWEASGARFIKVYPSLPWPLQRAVAEEARRRGLPVVGHGMSVEEIVKGVTLGFASLEHGPIGLGDDLIRLLAASGTAWGPTLAVMGGHELLTRGDPGRLDDPRFRAFVPEASIAEAKGGGMFGRMPEAALRSSWEARLARVRAARAGGVRLLAGTDALMTGTFFGPSLHWELEHFVEAGLPPLEVIRMATADAAAAVGASADLGTLEPGKLADLVLLDAGPLEDIRNTRAIWRVIKGGRVFDPERLRVGDPR